ncbi:MAG: dCTP deaminase [Candidatus Micrarchaeia archaeon]
MILSKSEILKALKLGRIGIRPLEPGSVGSCSVDLRLGRQFRVFANGCRGEKIKVDENAYFSKGFQQKTQVVSVKPGGSISLAPGELVLGVTKERIRLPADVCGRLEGRSRFARMGLLVHVSSSLVQPGVDNNQVLEIMNMSPFVLELTPGTRVCQIIFDEMKGASSYKGAFKKQSTV